MGVYSVLLLLLAAARTLLASPPDRDALDAALRGRWGLLQDRNDRPEHHAETLGLELELALLKGDEAGFARGARRLRRRFVTRSGLRWRVDAPPGEWCTNSSVDDLRAVRTLLGAHERWGNGAWRRVALRIGGAMLDHGTRDGLLVDAYSWRCHGREVAPAGAYLTLSFADLPGLSSLAEVHPGAAAVLERTREVVVAGAVHPDGPRWGFDLDAGRYDLRDDNPINVELLRIHVLDDTQDDGVRAAVCAQEDPRWRQSGNTAHLALAARRLHRCGRDDEAAAALGRAEALRFEDGPLAGLYGYRQPDGSEVVWAFDNLVAAIAWAELRAL